MPVIAHDVMGGTTRLQQDGHFERQLAIVATVRWLRRLCCVNAGQSGYYRVLYRPDMVAALKKDFAKLAPIDQLGLLKDNQSLSNGDYQPMRVSLDLLDAVDANSERRIIEDAVGSFGDSTTGSRMIPASKPGLRPSHPPVSGPCSPNSA